MVTAMWMVDRVQLAFTGRQLRTYVHKFVFLLLVYCRCSEGCRMGCMIWVSECRTMEMDRRDISRYQRHIAYDVHTSSILLPSTFSSFKNLPESLYGRRTLSISVSTIPNILFEWMYYKFSFDGSLCTVWPVCLQSFVFFVFYVIIKLDVSAVYYCLSSS